MKLILLGSPGAGKGTQAKFITEFYHLPQISTGEILRAAIQNGSDLGKKVKEIVESGRLVPDELMIQLIKERIKQSDCQNGFLLDGFPRTIAQAEALQKLTTIDCVVDIDVPEELIIQRLSGRRIHLPSGRTYHVINQPPREDNKDDITGEELIQRMDDQEETVRKRLSVYQSQTSPLRDYYQHSRDTAYFKIDGSKAIDEIKNNIFSLLNSLRKRVV